MKEGYLLLLTLGETVIRCDAMWRGILGRVPLDIEIGPLLLQFSFRVAYYSR